MKNLNENYQIMKKIIKIFYTISTLSSNGPQTLAWHIFNMGRKSFFLLIPLYEEWLLAKCSDFQYSYTSSLLWLSTDIKQTHTYTHIGLSSQQCTSQSPWKKLFGLRRSGQNKHSISPVGFHPSAFTNCNY